MNAPTLLQGIALCADIAERKRPEDFKLHNGETDLIRALRIETFVAALSGVLQREDMDMALSNRVFALLATPKKRVPQMSKKDILIIEGAVSLRSMRSATLIDVVTEEVGTGVTFRQPGNQEVTQYAGLVGREIKSEPTDTRISQPDTNATVAQQLGTHIRIGNDTDVGGGSSS